MWAGAIATRAPWLKEVQRPLSMVPKSRNYCLFSVRHQHIRCLKLVYDSSPYGQRDAVIAHTGGPGRTHIIKQSMQLGNSSARGVKSIKAVAAVQLATGNPGKT